MMLARIDDCNMGRTIVKATIIGPQDTRSYEFLVDTGSTFIGLPIEEIEALGLTPVPNGRIIVNTAEGLVERSTYIGVGELEGQGFSKEVIAMPIPLIGYEALDSLRFRVDPVTERIERVPDTEVHPPLAL